MIQLDLEIYVLWLYFTRIVAVPRIPLLAQLLIIFFIKIDLMVSISKILGKNFCFFKY